MSDIPSPAAPQASQLRERVRALQLAPSVERSAFNPWWIILAVALLGGAYAAWHFGLVAKLSAPAAAPSSEKKEDTAPATPADEGEKKPANAPESRQGIVLESKGYITPAHRILVSPKVSGMLTALNIEEGQRVKKGDVLGEIERVEYQADFDHAAATLEMAQQRFEEAEAGPRKLEKDQAFEEWKEAEARIEQLESEFKRTERLLKIGGISQAEFDQAEAAFNAQVRRVAKLKFAHELMEEGTRAERKKIAEAEVLQAKASLDRAKWRLDNCTIKSPISGTVLKKNAEEGNIVNPIAFNGSYSLCDLADLANLEVDLNVQERDVAKVFVGQKCKIRTEAYSQRVYDGVVDRLMPIADRAKGAVPVRVKVSVPAEEEGVYLKPDMSAIVTFYAKE